MVALKVFESGLRAWELDVGESERASETALADAVNYTVMMNMAPIFLRNNLQLGTYSNSAALRKALLQWCYCSETLEQTRQCQLEMEQARMMTTGCKSTLKRGKGRAKANIKTRKEIARTTRAIQTSTRARTVAELDIDRQTAGDQVEEPTTVPPVTTATDRQEPQERQRQRQTSGRCGNESKSSETASTVSYPSQTPSTIGALPCNPDVEQKRWDRGCDNHFRVLPQEDKLVQSNLLLDSGAQLHACPIKCSGQKVPLPDPGILTASGARLQHDRGRLVTFKLSEGRLFYACEVQKPILPLGCLAQQGCWSDLRADTGTLFFPDKIHAKQSQTQLHKVREFVLCQRDVGGALVDSWCE